MARARDARTGLRYLDRCPGYLRWWPDIYLEVEPIGSISASVGAKARLLTRGKLPYKLRWQAEIIEADRPISFVIRATGDFDGRGVWSLQQQDNGVAIAFDWRLRAEIAGQR